LLSFTRPAADGDGAEVADGQRIYCGTLLNLAVFSPYDSNIQQSRAQEFTFLEATCSNIGKKSKSFKPGFKKMTADPAARRFPFWLSAESPKGLKLTGE